MKTKYIVIAALAIGLGTAQAQTLPKPNLDQCAAMAQIGERIATERDEGVLPSKVTQEFVQAFPSINSDKAALIVKDVYVDRADESPKQLAAGFMQRCNNYGN